MERSDASLASFAIIIPRQDPGPVRQRIEQLATLVKERFTYYELVVVDDSGGQRHTAELRALVAAHEHIHYVRLSRSFGDDVAGYAGLDMAIGDHVVLAVLGRDPVERLPDLMEECQRTDEAYFGLALDKPKGGPLRRLGSWIFRVYAGRVLGVAIDRRATRLAALPRKAVNALLKVRDPSGYIGIQAGYVGIVSSWYPYQLDDPVRARHLEPLNTSVARALRIIAQNSVHPLRLLTYLGVLAAAFNLLYVLFILGIYLFRDSYPPGWVALSGQNAIYFFFISLFFIAISEYLGQIMVTVRQRPLYFVAEDRYSDTLSTWVAKRNVVDR
jgi:glycosyltransferase involved in cell wall biosynthesis